MRIDIRHKLCPFTHRIGGKCLIPGTEWEVTAYPTRLFFRQIHTGEENVLKLPLSGPVREFTLQLDLEKKNVIFSGFYPAGFFRLMIERQNNQIVILDKKTVIHTIPIGIFPEYSTVERLSLGSHRALDWENIRSRSDLIDILPVWFRLGYLVPDVMDRECKSGTPYFLHELKDAITSKDSQAVERPLLSLFQAGFSGILSPRLRDEEYQGLVSEGGAIPPEISPLILLREGAHLIRSLFFAEKKDQLEILPCLPTAFHSGRFIGILTADGDSIDIEWTKKLLQRVILRPAKTRSIFLALQKPIDSFRVRTSPNSRGKMQDRKAPLALEASKTLYLDRFQK